MDVQWPCVGKAADGSPEFSESIIQGKVGYALVPGWDQGDPTVDQREPHKNVITHPTIPFNRMGGISKLSKDPESAFLYMFHNFSRERIKQMHLEYYGKLHANTGNDPGLKFELDDPDFLNMWPTAKDYMENLKKSWAKPAIPDMIIPAYTEYATAIQVQMNNAWLGLIDAKKALELMAAEWDRITRRRGLDQQRAFWVKTIETYRKYLGRWPLD
jgi:ABC-type glycerol-3-phosphate transport system substrate-binding protein